MNREQARGITLAAEALAEATASARTWKQVHDTLPFVPELKKRYTEAEEHRRQIHEHLLIEINSAVTE